MKILITGGVGFIGTNAAIYFLEKGNDIVIVDDFSRPGVDKNAKYLTDTYGKTDRLTIVDADVNDTGKYQPELVKADAVIHLAGQTAVTTSLIDPVRDFHSNIKGTFTILEGIRNWNPACTILYSSTNKVYGDLGSHKMVRDDKNKRYDDADAPNGISESQQLDFISPYGTSKGAADQYVKDYNHSFGIKSVVFRQSCIYGRFQIGVEDQGWVAHFAKQFLLGNPITIFGDGYQVRDLLYVEDLVRAYELAIDNIDTVQGNAFNIGGGVANSVSLHQTLTKLKAMTGSDIEVAYQKERLGDQKYFVSENKKIKEKLGWEPTTKLDDGLAKMIEWQRGFYGK